MNPKTSKNDTRLGDPNQLAQVNTRIPWKLKRLLRDCRDMTKIKGDQLSEDAYRFYLNQTDEKLLARRKFVLAVMHNLQD
jgi:hypothetical protein